MCPPFTGTLVTMNLQASDSHTPRRKVGKLIAGSVLVFVGLVVVVAAGLYYGLGRYNSTQLDDLISAEKGPVAMQSVETDQTQVRGVLMPDGSFKPIQTGVKRIEVYVGDQKVDDRASLSAAPSPVAAVTSPTIQAASTVVPSAEQAQAPSMPTSDDREASDEAKNSAELVYAYNALYPGYQMHPKYWDNPLNAGADPFSYGAVKRPDGFISIESSQGMPKGAAPDANHIRIPSIGVDSTVSNLAIIDIGDSRQYETPKHVVGRIPETSNPGELGNTWLFGHLESPIRGEGNVFQKLPEIPALLNGGDPVYVSLINENGDEFLYQITATEVVHQDDLSLYQTEDATITLVSCVPRLVYDRRLLVTGKLVGVKMAA